MEYQSIFESGLIWRKSIVKSENMQISYQKFQLKAIFNFSIHCIILMINNLI